MKGTTLKYHVCVSFCKKKKIISYKSFFFFINVMKHERSFKYQAEIIGECSRDL